MNKKKKSSSAECGVPINYANGLHAGTTEWRLDIIHFMNCFVSFVGCIGSMR